LEHATGDYIYNVDPDDWLAEGALKKMAMKIAETGCDLLYFGLVKVYAKRKSYKHQRTYTAEERGKFVWDIYNHHAMGSLCNKCFKRTLFEQHTIHTPKFSHAEDCFVSSQLVGYATNIAYLDEMLYCYRKDNPAAMSRKAVRKRKREYAHNFLNLYELYRDIPTEQNPVAVIFDDIVMQAGWYSTFYRLNLFTEFPYLASAIRRAKIHRGTDVPIVAQLITKLVALFK
jgi:CDP-glycerol glycerophosphotransferase